MSSKRPVAPPPRIQGFTYISLLGSGGFSDVYLYEQDRPRRKVAVKVLLSDLKTEGFMAEVHEKWFGTAPDPSGATVTVRELPKSGT